MLVRSVLVFALFALPVFADEKSVALSPIEARKQVGKEIAVKMVVKTAKDRLESRGEIYLDAEDDFATRENSPWSSRRSAAESLKAAGVTDPADHFAARQSGRWAR